MVELPKERKAITNKWVYRVKENGKHKARLVAKGCSQKYGTDYQDTFSPVAQFKSTRLLLGIAAVNKMHIAQFDVKTAFLNGRLSEEIYMMQPDGYEDGTNRVCRLKRSIYGLKQAPRCWNKKFVNVLEKFELQQSKCDSCVFMKFLPEMLFLIIYVDDGLIISTNEEQSNKLLKHLEEELEIKREELKVFLGMEITRSDEGIFICQTNYAKKILEKFNMENCKPVETPATTTDFIQNENKIVDVPYREAIGSLLFLSSVTRPDIAFIINKLSRFMENPQEQHWLGIKRVLRYLRGTVDYGLFFSAIKTSEGDVLQCYSDSDFGGDTETRKSTTGYVLTFCGTAIDWFSRRQSVVALSTAEAEYVAASDSVKELLCLLKLFREVQVQKEPITVNIDNQSAIVMIQDEGAHKRTKHIDIRFHFIKEMINKEICLNYIETNNQLADIFTKSLPKLQFMYLRGKLNLRKIGGSVECNFPFV